MLLTALGFEPRSFGCRSSALTTELHRPETLDDIRRYSCGEGDVGRLCISVIRAVDRESKDLGSNPSAVKSVLYSTERFQILQI